MGFFKSSKEILAAAADFDIAFVWGADRVNQWLCNCAIYLYIILEGD